MMCMGAANITRIIITAICELFDTNVRSLQISEVNFAIIYVFFFVIM